MRKLTTILAALLLCTFLVAGNSFATAIIDFGGGGGEISYDGNNVVGTDIQLDILIVEGTPETAYSKYDTGDNEPLLNFDTQANTVSITGDIINGIYDDGKDLGSMNIDSSSDDNTLLEGNIVGYSWSTSPLDPNGFIFNAWGEDEKDSALLASFGLDADTEWVYYSFTLTGSLIDTLDDGTKIYRATSVDIKNTAVPEPATMLLFGTGLIGLAAIGRKKYLKK